MNASTSDVPRWSSYRWWATIGALFAAQAGMLVWLEDRETAGPPHRALVTVVHLGENVPRNLAVEEDPALFALPNGFGFSGDGWLKASSIANASSDWTEAPRFLPLETAELGALFGRVVGTHAVATLAVADKQEPAPDSGEYFPAVNLLAGATTWRLEGLLAGRPLAIVPEPGRATTTNLLADSRVELVVDRAGRVVSSALRPSEGAVQAAADQAALATAMALEFEPDRRAGGDAHETGTLVIHWAAPATQ